MFWLSARGDAKLGKQAVRRFELLVGGCGAAEGLRDRGHLYLGPRELVTSADCGERGRGCSQLAFREGHSAAGAGDAPEGPLPETYGKRELYPAAQVDRVGVPDAGLVDLAERQKRLAQPGSPHTGGSVIYAPDSGSGAARAMGGVRSPLTMKILPLVAYFHGSLRR